MIQINFKVSKQVNFIYSAREKRILCETVEWIATIFQTMANKNICVSIKSKSLGYVIQKKKSFIYSKKYNSRYTFSPFESKFYQYQIYISRFIDKKHMMKVITAHLFSMLYYAAPVWLNPLTRQRHITMLNSIHYRAMRLSIGDWRNKIPRREVDLKCKRATPTQWMAYCNAKVAIELTNLNKDGPQLSEKMYARCYVNERRPGLGTFMDESRLRIGRNSLPNRLEVMKSINFDWFGDINKHSLRINLKKTIIKWFW